MRTRFLLAGLVVLAAIVVVPEAGAVPLGAVGNATPSTVQIGASTLLTVTVTASDNPPSTGIGVVCNLGPIGGTLTLLYDDGTNGDATANDLTFSRLVTIPATTPTGATGIFCTVNDAQAQTAFTTISLDIVPAAQNEPPTVNAGGPYVVDEGSTVQLSATGTDPEGAPLTYAWDLDNNGTFETSGQSVPFTGLDGPATQTVSVRAVDPGGLDATDTTTVTVRNVPPTVSAPAGQAASEGTPGSFALGSFSDPGGAQDSPYSVSVNWGDGSPALPFDASAPGSLGSATHTFPDSGTYIVSVTVTDKDGATGQASFSVAVANVAPEAVFTAPASVFAGSSFTLSLTDPQDPSAADTAAGFTYAFDCGDGAGYGAFGPASSVLCTAPDTGSSSVGAKIRDKDGGVTEYRATVQVILTFDGLCALTRQYATKHQIADALCNKLGNAATAPSANARNGLLNAYQNQVDAQTGKVFTADQAEVLKRLADQLRL